MRTRIELVIAGFKNSLYKSREDAAKSHGVDLNTLRRRLNGKHISQSRAYSAAAITTSSVYILQTPAFLLEFERSKLLLLRFLKNKQESFLPINHYYKHYKHYKMSR